MEAPRTPLDDLVPFTEAFWENPAVRLRECRGLLLVGVAHTNGTVRSGQVSYDGHVDPEESNVNVLNQARRAFV